MKINSSLFHKSEIKLTFEEFYAKKSKIRLKQKRLFEDRKLTKLLPVFIFNAYLQNQIRLNKNKTLDQILLFLKINSNLWSKQIINLN
jgi:hypothetical protein